MKICPSTAVLWIDDGSPETKYMHKRYLGIWGLDFGLGLWTWTWTLLVN